MKAIGELKNKVTDLEQYKKKFMDQQDYETNYLINLKDDKTVSQEQKIDFFFHKLMAIRSELKSFRVDYEKKRQRIQELNEQYSEIEIKMKTIRDEKINLQKTIQSKDLKYESLLDKCTKQKDRIKSMKNELNEYKRSIGLPLAAGLDDKSNGFSFGFNNKVKQSLNRVKSNKGSLGRNGTLGFLGQIKKQSTEDVDKVSSNEKETNISTDFGMPKKQTAINLEISKEPPNIKRNRKKKNKFLNKNMVDKFFTNQAETFSEGLGSTSAQRKAAENRPNAIYDLFNPRRIKKKKESEVAQKLRTIFNNRK